MILFFYIGVPPFWKASSTRGNQCMAINDTNCLYWEQVLLDNTKLNLYLALINVVANCVYATDNRDQHCSVVMGFLKRACSQSSNLLGITYWIIVERVWSAPLSIWWRLCSAGHINHADGGNISNSLHKDYRNVEILVLNLFIFWGTLYVICLFVCLCILRQSCLSITAGAANCPITIGYRHSMSFDLFTTRSRHLFVTLLILATRRRY